MPDPVAAGKRSGEVRRAKAEARKKLKDIVQDATYAHAPLPSEKLKQVAKLLKKPVKDVTVGDVAIFQQAMSAMKGDMGALLFLRDMLGEKPADKVQGTMELKADFDIVIEPEEDEHEQEEEDGQPEPD